jgi:hypothetical protein
MILKFGSQATGVMIFSGGFRVASVCGPKKTLWSMGSERLKRHKKLKFCRQLPRLNSSGPRNFIQLNLLNFNLNFSKTNQ